MDATDHMRPFTVLLGESVTLEVTLPGLFQQEALSTALLLRDLPNGQTYFLVSENRPVRPVTVTEAWHDPRHSPARVLAGLWALQAHLDAAEPGPCDSARALVARQINAIARENR